MSVRPVHQAWMPGATVAVATRKMGSCTRAIVEGSARSRPAVGHPFVDEPGGGRGTPVVQLSLVVGVDAELHELAEHPLPLRLGRDRLNLGHVVPDPLERDEHVLRVQLPILGFACERGERVADPVVTAVPDVLGERSPQLIEGLRGREASAGLVRAIGSHHQGLVPVQWRDTCGASAPEPEAVSSGVGRSRQYIRSSSATRPEGGPTEVYAFGIPDVARTHDVDGVMQEVTVLILVRDILGAGLFAALVDSMGRTPVYPFPGERAESAVERVRPSWLLLECHHPAARSDTFYAAAAAVGAPVIIFAPGTPWEDCEDVAHRHGVAAFVHGGDGRSLADL